MPGLVVFRRRWSVGSDDMVVPGAFLFTTHLIWTVIMGAVLFVVNYDKSVQCVLLLWGLVVGYLGILLLSMAIEICVCIVALRGSILDTSPRSSMQYILYIRLSVMVIEAGWLSAGIAWLMKYYVDCPVDNAKETVLAMVVFNWCILLSVLITVWCCYDTAGRSWVKMKQYQRSMRESESKFQYKRSGSTRNWRQRKVLRAYQDSWQNRCRFLFCCSTPSDRNRNSFADIARLLSDFFRDLDVVPSDVVVGLVLLRKFQKIERKAIVEQRKNDTYEFLSGVAVTPRTRFLTLHEGGDLELFQTVIHFAHFAVGAYGWPLYVVSNKLGVCHLCTGLHCCCVPCRKRAEVTVDIIEDNCCHCNYAALQKISEIGDIEIIYVTYHVDVGETPFFVAVDYDRKKIVISVRGTLSMKDILTDLNAESETIPLDPPREDFLGHKGMVQAAQYIMDKIVQEQLIERAKSQRPERGTKDYELVIVGHSLGAGTASILGILMRRIYPSLLCYCYSPPGGLLSAPAVEYSKEFTVSVVVGKDVVPRIGLHQMETLRTDLINAIKRSVDPKWKTITCSIICCGCSQPTSAVELSTNERDVCEYMRSKENARCMGMHPADSTIALSSHQPLYPPGRIIHVVRHHPTSGQQALSKKEPVYQALWAKNTDFDEVLISPVMIQDHMPDKVLDALNKCVTGGTQSTPTPSGKPRGRNAVDRAQTSPLRHQVVTTLGPKKPHRSSSTTDSTAANYFSASSNPNLFLETSFTSLQCPSTDSSITNGYYSTKSHPSPLSLRQPLANFNLSFRSNKSDTLLRNNVVSPQKEESAPACITKSLSLNLYPKVDLIHDDWLGLAPLASPESLSELSSISSRTSLAATNVVVEICKTPKLMRRTPKIIGSLSTCADDIRNVRNFELCKVFPRLIINNNNSESSSSSNLSFESASSSNKCCSNAQRNVPNSCHKNADIKECCATSESEFQSAEDILDNVLSSAGCKEFFNSESNFLDTHGDLLQDDSPPSAYFRSTSTTPAHPQLLSPSSPQDIDPDFVSNLAIDLSLDEEHRSIQFHQNKQESSVDSGSMCRTPSDTTKNVTFNPQVITVDSACETHYSPPVRWRLFRGKSSKKAELPKLPPITATVTSAVPIKTILSTKNRKMDETADRLVSEECFSRTEALPLLSGLGSSASERTPSPSFVRRKKYVYPSDVVVMNKTTPHESAV
ncbi:diacylglycerol lipase-alpha isoform X2 [Cylas formicarius]|uniref:diacylglycerol lipase-alpha isoform X2 n=1 Tax=Cylas formicarius TaxID=197179 RepID=UPI0029588716|nr:diacylglycerol lipase-alpha isoform X2 [Cylas formicarius]